MQISLIFYLSVHILLTIGPFIEWGQYNLIAEIEVGGVKKIFVLGHVMVALRRSVTQNHEHQV